MFRWISSFAWLKYGKKRHKKQCIYLEDSVSGDLRHDLPGTQSLPASPSELCIPDPENENISKTHLTKFIMKKTKSDAGGEKHHAYVICFEDKVLGLLGRYTLIKEIFTHAPQKNTLKKNCKIKQHLEIILIIKAG